jgi:hypothetical protein
MATPIAQLPFPHGTASGQIGNNAQISLSDTPGSSGGRFVGFGEPGTSGIANRASWALSLNVDTIFTGILSVPIAVNAALRFTSTGQDRVQIAIADPVFCGDATYPGAATPADPEGMQALFSVMDAQYNALTDTSGNEVRVHAVYDSADSTEVYQQGFVPNPWARFCTVDPLTGAIVNPAYTIPNATAVRLIYGVRTNLKDMPFTHPDAFTRFRSLTGEDVPPGVVLQDGSRSMTGDLNLATHKITGCQSIGLAPLGSPYSGIGVMNPINVTPVNGTAPNIFMAYGSTGTEINARENYAGLYLMAPGPHTVQLAISMIANLGVATPAADMLFTVISAGDITRQMRFGVDGVLGPNSGTTLSLGTASLPWADAYLTTIRAPLSDPQNAIHLGSYLAGSSTGSAVNFRGGLNVEPFPGHYPFVETVYTIAGVEPPGLASLAGYSMRLVTGDISGSLVLQGDPTIPGASASSLELSMYNSYFGTVGVGLERSAYWTAFRPIGDMAVSLGTAGSRWSTLFSYYVYASEVVLDNSRALSTFDGGNPILIDKGLDYDFFSDFQSRAIFADSTNIKIDDNYVLDGTGGQTFFHQDHAGRETVCALTTEAIVDGRGIISGSKVASLTANAWRFRLCLELLALSGGVNPTYRFDAGFGDASNPETSISYCYFTLNEYANSIGFSWNDGFGNSGIYDSGLVLNAGQYYTLEMVFYKNNTFQAYIDGGLLGPLTTFAPASTSFYYVPLQVINMSGDGPVAIYVDFIDAHSEGHVAR